ncbi:hypothetical protein [Chryseolinea sp. H1M3-3]|uniref:hypothetical protein n=1 Tax=Chryseolinea sp. H1M3-3 TaxID=3034144 RepID=UPI0023EDADA5|nr:hypothetical protein [Chryseolinea sp. H1M3-3]
MKKLHQHISACLLMFCILFSADELLAQTTASKNRILIDIAHGQKFWNDPATMKGDQNSIERVKYMTAELNSTASSVNADLGYLKEKIKSADLATCNLLFIHLPSSKYDADEVDAIKRYLQKGGALFLVMDEDYWTTLDLTNVNDILSISNIKFGNNNPDTLSGGYTKPSALTDKKLKVTYHGGRIVTGGTPFCYDNQSEKYPFGAFTKLKGGGKIVAMGDGMVSLYMTSWKNINDYQCREFMHEVFAWLMN